MIWSVPQFWKGEVAFILAGGPSLKGFDASVLTGRKVITINDSWRLFPDGIHYFCDNSWWQNQVACNRWDMKMSRSFHDQIYKGFWVSGYPGFSTHPQVHFLQLTGESGLETNPSGLRHGSNSGYQTINLAYHLGVQRIVLLGYDMRCQGTTTHWHHEDRASSIHFSVTLEKSFLPHFKTLVEPLKKAGVEVINATPDSALDCWPRASLKDLLD